MFAPRSLVGPDPADHAAHRRPAARTLGQFTGIPTVASVVALLLVVLVVLVVLIALSTASIGVDERSSEPRHDDGVRLCPLAPCSA